MESRNVKQLEYEVQQKQLTLQEIDVELRKELMRKELLNEIYGMDSVDQSESDVQEDMSNSGSSVTNSLRSSMLERQVDEIRQFMKQQVSKQAGKQLIQTQLAKTIKYQEQLDQGKIKTCWLRTIFPVKNVGSEIVKHRIEDSEQIKRNRQSLRRESVEQERQQIRKQLSAQGQTKKQQQTVPVFYKKSLPSQMHLDEYSLKRRSAFTKILRRINREKQRCNNASLAIHVLTRRG